MNCIDCKYFTWYCKDSKVYYKCLNPKGKCKTNIVENLGGKNEHKRRS